MDWKHEFEKFHDTNRYFIPLIGIGLILMITGWFYNSTVVLTGDVQVDKLLLFSGDRVIQAVTLKPGWIFNIEVVASKPINLSLTNLAGEVVASSSNHKLSYQPQFLDLYFVNVHGPVSYAVIDFNYSKSGLAPYPTPFLFFGTGLLLVIGVLVYYLLEPWVFKLKRKLTMTDAIFFPFMFLMASVIFWVFRDSLIWFVPRNMDTTMWLLLIPCLLLAGCIWTLKTLNDNKRVFFLLNNKGNNDFFKSLFGFFVADLLIFINIVFDFSGLLVGNDLLIPLLIIVLLIVVYLKTDTKNALVIYSLTWLTSILVKMLSYSIGIPVVFDTFLSAPSRVGIYALFGAIISMALLGIYFLVRGYYSKKTYQAINFGLYASVCLQAIMQIYSGSSLI